ncbi:MAG TPA: hypothetical protein DDX93_00730 [Smithella sp.]|jgi:hypothetical protein|nr:hypothetical protein [Smithella sp.]
MKYRIYIDEVGNPDLDSSENPNHQFLSLTGVIIELEYAATVLHPQMEAIKQRYFHAHPDEPIIFHRKEMFNNRHPFEALSDTGIRESFDNDLLHLMKDWQYTVLSVCLDKKKHKETYSVWRFDPYHYCLAVLLERFVFFLKRNGASGDAMAESRGGKEDIRLKDSFERLWENGTDFVAPEQFQACLTSRQLKVKTKANNIAGLQLCDLIAHSSRNEILREQSLFTGRVLPFGEKVIKILESKYDCEGQRCFGKKFI